jgi:hypothetical protein
MHTAGPVTASLPMAPGYGYFNTVFWILCSPGISTCTKKCYHFFLSTFTSSPFSCSSLLCFSNTCIYLCPCSPLLGLCPFFHLLDLLHSRRTPWTGDQPFVRPLPTHTEQTHTDIHALSGIRTHDPSVGASEDRSCLRPYGHFDRVKGQ